MRQESDAADTQTVCLLIWRELDVRRSWHRMGPESGAWRNGARAAEAARRDSGAQVQGAERAAQTADAARRAPNPSINTFVR